MKRYDSLDMSKEEFSDVGQAFFLFHGGRSRYLFKVTKGDEPATDERILIDECKVPFRLLSLGYSKKDDKVMYLFAEAMLNEV